MASGAAGACRNLVGVICQVIIRWEVVKARPASPMMHFLLTSSCRATHHPSHGDALQRLRRLYGLGRTAPRRVGLCVCGRPTVVVPPSEDLSPKKYGGSASSGREQRRRQPSARQQSVRHHRARVRVVCRHVHGAVVRQAARAAGGGPRRGGAGRGRHAGARAAGGEADHAPGRPHSAYPETSGPGGPTPWNMPASCTAAPNFRG